MEPLSPMLVVEEYEALLKWFAHMKEKKKKRKREVIQEDEQTEIEKRDQWRLFSVTEEMQRDGVCSHEQLVNLGVWKMTRGKWRPRNKAVRGARAMNEWEKHIGGVAWYAYTVAQLLESNEPETVEAVSREAFQLIGNKTRPSEKSVVKALDVLCRLKGVGVATASSVLSAFAPNNIPFMSDDSMLGSGAVHELKYDVNTYKRYLRRCWEEVDNRRRRAQTNDDEWPWDVRTVELMWWSDHIRQKHRDEIQADGREDLLERLSAQKDEQDASDEISEKECENGEDEVVDVEDDDDSTDRMQDDVDEDDDDKSADRMEEDVENDDDDEATAVTCSPTPCNTPFRDDEEVDEFDPEVSLLTERIIVDEPRTPCNTPLHDGDAVGEEADLSEEKLRGAVAKATSGVVGVKRNRSKDLSRHAKKQKRG